MPFHFNLTVLINFMLFMLEEKYDLVLPEDIDDYQADDLADNIAEKIQAELEYPGQIKITVIREKRAISYAK